MKKQAPGKSGSPGTPVELETGPDEKRAWLTHTGVDSIREALDWLELRRYERGSSYMNLYQNAHCGPAKGFYNFGRIHASPKWGGERTWG